MQHVTNNDDGCGGVHLSKLHLANPSTVSSEGAFYLMQVAGTVPANCNIHAEMTGALGLLLLLPFPSA